MLITFQAVACRVAQEPLIQVQRAEGETRVTTEGALDALLAALPELRLTGADGGDGAHPLVAQDQRQFRLERPVAVVRRTVTPSQMRSG